MKILRVVVDDSRDLQNRPGWVRSPEISVLPVPASSWKKTAVPVFENVGANPAGSASTRADRPEIVESAPS